VALLEV